MFGRGAMLHHPEGPHSFNRSRHAQGKVTRLNSSHCEQIFASYTRVRICWSLVFYIPAGYTRVCICVVATRVLNIDFQLPECSSSYRR